MSLKTFRTSKFIDVEVEIDLNEFYDDELIQELQRRNVCVDYDFALLDIIDKMHTKYILNQTMEEELRKLFYVALNRIV